MPTCVMCGHDNPEGAKYCSNCSAVLPKAAPTGQPKSRLNVGELLDVPKLETHFYSPSLVAMAWSVEALLEGEGTIDEVLEAYEFFVETFENTQAEFPQVREIFYQERAAFPDDPFPDQLNYLITKSEECFNKGREAMENFMLAFEEEEGDPEQLCQAVQLLLHANDNLFSCLHILHGRIEGFKPVLEEMQAELERKGLLKDGKPVLPESEAQEVPVDTADL